MSARARQDLGTGRPVSHPVNITSTPNTRVPKNFQVPQRGIMPPHSSYTVERTVWGEVAGGREGYQSFTQQTFRSAGTVPGSELGVGPAALRARSSSTSPSQAEDVDDALSTWLYWAA